MHACAALALASTLRRNGRAAHAIALPRAQAWHGALPPHKLESTHEADLVHARCNTQDDAAREPPAREVQTTPMQAAGAKRAEAEARTAVGVS